MEPRAPGTEDESIDFNSLTKKETENERLLKQKAILKNGQYENIFELSYVGGAEHWFCKVCECPIMGRVYQHELGRRHATNLHMTNRHLDKTAPSNDGEREDLAMPIDVAPGEPVPPGFEGEVNRQAQIQERLDGFKVGPLVALEYLIEMHDYDATKEPFYLCILCDKRGDPRTVLTHLASYNHISQYLQKHFPTCYRALAPYMTKQYKRNWQTVLQKIAEAIEKKFGRLRPFSIEQDKFEKDRLQFLTMISKGKHFSEHQGHTFVDLVVHDELIKNHDEDGKPVQTGTNWSGKPFIEKTFQKRSPSPPVVAHPAKKVRPQMEVLKNDRPLPRSATMGTRRRSLSSVSSLSSDEEPGKRNRTARNKSPPAKNAVRDAGRKLPYNTERAFRRISPTPPPRKPWERERDFRKLTKEEEDQRQKNREKERLEKLEEYKKLSKAIENDMEKTLKNHEKNPEKHPKYNDEWKLFWNRRYKELQAQGLNAAKHDFKPEWIEFWGKKMLDLHHEELKSRKDGLRRRLGLPEEPTPISFRIGGAGGTTTTAPKTASKPPPAKELNRPNMPMAARPDNDPEVIIIDDKDSDIKVKTRVPNRTRSYSPWERESPPLKTSIRPNNPVKERKRSPSAQSRDLLDSHTSKAKDRSVEKRRSLERKRSLERGRRSRSRDRDSLRRSRDGSLRRSHSRSPDSYRGRRSYGRYSRERSWERERKTRESSYERDIRGRERVRTVADLPWEREKIMYPRSLSDYENYYAPPPMLRDVSRKPMVLPPPMQHLQMLEMEEDSGEVNIVSVLRLLTALEERLGSLGPKIIDLLAQALALEKKEANSSESLLDNEINCVMFETVKEKLKGQLLAGLVDPIQERAFKRAIHKTANLIHIAEQRKRQREQLKPVQAAVAVPGVGPVDKAAIARQLANALVAQGKTNVTQNELEQLINAVVGMAEASKNSRQPMTTASFLSQLSGAGVAGNKSPEPQKDRIIIPRVKRSEEKGEEKSKDRDVLADLDKLTEPLSPGTPERSSTSNMENLSDSDLQTLLQNFKDLSTDEQMNLINYLKKLELDEPERVERLRKFVNLGSEKGNDKDPADLDREETNRDDRESPFSTRIDGVNPESDDYEKPKKENKQSKIHLDSEDEDYSYEDVVKAASKNIKQKEMEDNRKIVEDSIGFDTAKKEVDLSDAKALISNLMSSFSSNASSSGINLLGLATSSSNTLANSTSGTTPTSSADFAKTFSSINVANLASIVSSVQSINTQTPSTTTEAQNLQMGVCVRTSESSVDFKGSSLESDLRLSNPLASEDPLRTSDSIQNPRGPSYGSPGISQAPSSFNQSPSSINQSPRGPNQGPQAGSQASRGPSQGIPSANQGPRGTNQGSRGLLGPGPRVPGSMGLYPQRILNPNLFGNNYAPNSFGNQPGGFANTRPSRPLFHHSFGTPRFGVPRPGPGPGPGGNFNNRW